MHTPAVPDLTEIRDPTFRRTDSIIQLYMHFVHFVQNTHGDC
jgi:hypothetical protein